MSFRANHRDIFVDTHKDLHFVLMYVCQKNRISMKVSKKVRKLPPFASNLKRMKLFLSRSSKKFRALCCANVEFFFLYRMDFYSVHLKTLFCNSCFACLRCYVICMHLPSPVVPFLTGQSNQGDDDNTCACGFFCCYIALDAI